MRIFRVDNPHTKPIPFWAWVIGEIQAVHPDVIFLAEAFTRPKVMQALAKVGFTQSYTYFTWRNFKAGTQEYFTELTQGVMAEYFRGNLFTNTPDILPPDPPAGRAAGLQDAAGPGGHPVLGVRDLQRLRTVRESRHAGHRGVPGLGEVRDQGLGTGTPGNIKDYVARSTDPRENPALHEYRNLRFYPSDDDNVLFYGKTERRRRQHRSDRGEPGPFRAAPGGGTPAPPGVWASDRRSGSRSTS